mmetsp:Transcript_37050/g.35773  ORF Transcript_37050/g.35773 Transcript_37050/m.35773 type:complete len:107 (-) Transcript_37050:912-1232(-)
MQLRLNYVELDKKCLQQLVKIKRRSEFIAHAQLNMNLFRFEPDDFIELVNENETSKRGEQLQKELDEYREKYGLNKKEEVKQVNALEGNLAMKFLLKSGNLNDLMV